MRLIDADTLKGEFTGNFMDAYLTALVHTLIDSAPTIDAVQVVRCKNCVYSLSKNEYFYKGLIFCTRNGKRFYENDYCSNGEHI